MTCKFVAIKPSAETTKPVPMPWRLPSRPVAVMTTTDLRAESARRSTALDVVVLSAAGASSEARAGGQFRARQQTTAGQRQFGMDRLRRRPAGEGDGGCSTGGSIAHELLWRRRATNSTAVYAVGTASHFGRPPDRR